MGYNPSDTLNILRDQGQVSRDQQRYMTDDMANSIRETGAIAGKTIRDLPGQFYAGRDVQQRYRMTDSEEGRRAAREERDAAQSKLDQQKTNMELGTAKRREKYLTEETQPGKTREQTLWDQQSKDADLQRQFTKAQLDRLNKDDAASVRDQKVLEAATIMAQAKAKGDQGSYSAALASLSPEDQAFAEAKAAQLHGSAVASGNITFAGSMSGQQALADANTAAGKLQNIPKALDALKKYDDVDFYSLNLRSERERAERDINATLAQYGKSLDDYDAAFRTPTQAMKMAIDDIVNEAELELASLENQYANSGSQELQARIAQARSELDRIKTEKSGRGGNVGVFNTPQGQKSAIQRAAGGQRVDQGMNVGTGQIQPVSAGGGTDPWRQFGK